MKPKYIIFTCAKNAIDELPVIFPNEITHSTMARSVMVLPSLRVPVSAGFYHISDKGTYVCTGHSESLNLKSRPIDSDILTRFLT